MKKFFKVLHRSTHLRQGFDGRRKSKARVGEIYTAHGAIKTPAFVPVATKGTVKAILPSLLKEIKTQAAFVNTYHLVSHPGADFIAKAGGIHKWAKLDIPLMSDSGGFQVFSLARKRENNEQMTNDKLQMNDKSQITKQADIRGEEQPLIIKISDDGVKFRSTYDGRTIEFTPEKSIEYQMKIGADMMMAFDECTYYPATHEYSEKATERTHEWLTRCIKYFKKPVGGACLGFIPADARFEKYPSTARRLPAGKAGRDPFSSTPANILNRKKKVFSLSNNYQFLYGIIQGAIFEDLRKKSAEFVVSQNTDGVAIGGVSVGETKKEMRDQVKWVSDYLPKDRPVHLLGIGQFDDILDLVGYGIDSFDCVEPTRLARMGKLYKSWQGLSRIHSRRCSLRKIPLDCAPPGPFLLDTRHLKSQSFEIDIFKSKYKYDLSAVDENCECYVCKNFTKSYLHHLFKQREILGYSLATYHNLWVMERFFEEIRELISSDVL